MSDTNKTQAVLSQGAKSIAHFLKILSDNPLSTSDDDDSGIMQKLGLWSDHILEGGNSPSNQASHSKRDWRGLNEFFEEYRKWEVGLAESTIGNMREFIWQFLRTISSNITEDQSDLSTVNFNLEKLQSALSIDSIETLKKEVNTVVTILQEKSSEREKRYNEQVRMLGKRLKQMRIELEKTKQQLGSDGLTGIYNRAALDEHLHRVVDIGVLSGTPTSLLMIDIDHFKKFNDKHGHQTGDLVLVSLASLLQKIFPRKTDFVARYGGEEFSVVFAEDDAKIAKMLADKLVKAVSEEKVVTDDNKELQITVSIGVAEKNSGETIEQWVKRADQALYRAKELGRNVACLAN